MQRVLCYLILFLLLESVTTAQSREEKVRNDRQKVLKAGLWHYNDLKVGLEEAQRTGKPLMVVFRCIPCTECVKLDEDLMEQDATLMESMKQFIRVRQTSNNGIDLSSIQFDFDQSFTVLFFHGDGTLIGRYGTRSHRTEWTDDVSIEGLHAAMKQVLAWYSDFDAIRPYLAGKQSNRLAISDENSKVPGAFQNKLHPEDYETLSKYPSNLDYEGTVVKNCIHCHQLAEAQKNFALTSKNALPTQLLFPYPNPRILGIQLDVTKCSTIRDIIPGSLADRVGLKSGDQITSIGGHAPLSIADIQWVLHLQTEDHSKIGLVIERQGNTHTVELELPANWKHKDDISWRASTWELRQIALGGMVLNELDLSEKAKRDIAPDKMALMVTHVGWYPPHDRAKKAGFEKGDIVLSAAKITEARRETDLIQYLLDKHLDPAGIVSDVEFQVLRGVKTLSLKLGK